MLISISDNCWFICIPTTNVLLLNLLLSLFGGLYCGLIIWAVHPDRNLKLLKSTSLCFIYKPVRLIVGNTEIVFFVVDFFWIMDSPKTFIIEASLVLFSLCRLSNVVIILGLFFVTIFISIVFYQIMSIFEGNNPTDCWIIPSWYLNLILSLYFDNLVIISPWAFVLFLKLWGLRSCCWYIFVKCPIHTKIKPNWYLNHSLNIWRNFWAFVRPKRFSYVNWQR